MAKDTLLGSVTSMDWPTLGFIAGAGLLGGATYEPVLCFEIAGLGVSIGKGGGGGGVATTGSGGGGGGVATTGIGGGTGGVADTGCGWCTGAGWVM